MVVYMTEHHDSTHTLPFWHYEPNWVITWLKTDGIIIWPVDKKTEPSLNNTHKTLVCWPCLLIYNVSAKQGTLQVHIHACTRLSVYITSL